MSVNIFLRYYTSNLFLQATQRFFWGAVNPIGATVCYNRAVFPLGVQYVAVFDCTCNTQKFFVIETTQREWRSSDIVARWPKINFWRRTLFAGCT